MTMFDPAAFVITFLLAGIFIGAIIDNLGIGALGGLLIALCMGFCVPHMPEVDCRIKSSNDMWEYTVNNCVANGGEKTACWKIADDAWRASHPTSTCADTKGQ